MADKNITIVRQVSEKNENGTLNDPVPIGATFETVVDTRATKGNHTLAQFFDSYIDFMTNADFVYKGATEPTNGKTAVWVDTSHASSEYWG